MESATADAKQLQSHMDAEWGAETLKLASTVVTSAGQGNSC